MRVKLAQREPDRTQAPATEPPATLVAVIGLLVNLVCALIFRDAHHHHEHAHCHDDHGHHHHDLNLRAAYIHVLADALTSVTAIVALTAGKFLG